MTKLALAEINDLIEAYARWVKDKTILKQVDDTWAEITTPNLDRHNDYLQIYVRLEGDHYLLTDDGYTINDLEMSGCQLKSPNRRALLDMTLMGFGVRLERDHLIMEATKANFPIKKHNLLQAMLSVNDMFYLSSPHIMSLFYEDVTNWLDETNVRYSSRIKLPGKSGYDHMFDFVIPKSKTKPERLVQLANNPTKEKIKDLMFKWFDTKETRGNEVISYVILNNKESSVAQAAIDALLSYETTPILWTDREEFEDDLAA
jgi:hypothetical protein